MKDTFYFSHDYNARQDPKLQNLMMVHGLAGIGAYWCIIELLYEQTGRMKMDNIKMLAFSLHCKPSLIESLIHDFDLFQHDDSFFWSESVLNRIQERDEATERRKNAAIKRWDTRNKNMKNECNADAMQMQNEYDLDEMHMQCSTSLDEMQMKNECNADAMQMQCNAIKGKERKEEEKENPLKGVKEKEQEKEAKSAQRFCPPSLKEVQKYVAEKGYSVDSESFIAFYDSKGWFIGKNKMKDWKAAVVTWAKRKQPFGTNIRSKTTINTQCNDEWQ